MLGRHEVRLESVPCPLGCAFGDDPILVARDYLHGLPGEFTLVKCRACGLMRTNPRPTPDTIGLYYPDDYGPYRTTQIAAGVAPVLGRKRQATLPQRTMGIIFDTDTRKLPRLPAGRMLEVGCASGAFLHQMAVQGWQVEGLEFSEKAAHAARALGYPVRTGTLEAAPDPREPLDLVVGWHVFEHFHDPICALQKFRRWTKPGGWLVLSMPDAGSWEFRIFGDKWYALQVPTHLYHYTPETLSRVLARAGWRRERLFWHNNANNLLHSLRYCCLDRGWNRWADYLSDMVEGRRQRNFLRFLARFLGGLHASGRMTVWARRL